MYETAYKSSSQKKTDVSQKLGNFGRVNKGITKVKSGCGETTRSSGSVPRGHLHPGQSQQKDWSSEPKNNAGPGRAAGSVGAGTGGRAA